jgi:hypothetical protein
MDRQRGFLVYPPSSSPATDLVPYCGTQDAFGCEWQSDSIKSESEEYCFPALLIHFAKDRVVFLTAESEANAKVLRQPFFCDTASVGFRIQQKVECAIVPLDNLENLARSFG